MRITGKAVFDGQQRAMVEPALALKTAQSSFLVRPGDATQVTPQHHRNGDDERQGKHDMDFTGKPGPHTHQGQAQKNAQQRHAAPDPGQQVFPPDRATRQTHAARYRSRAAGRVGKGLCHHKGSLGPGAVKRRDFYAALALVSRSGILSRAIASSWLGRRRTMAKSSPRTMTSGTRSLPL